VEERCLESVTEWPQWGGVWSLCVCVCACVRSLSEGHSTLNEQLFDVNLQLLDLRLELRVFVHNHRGSNHWPCNAACTSQRSLRLYKDVWHVLVFAKQRQVKQDFERLSICCKHDKFRLSTVKRLCGFVGTLLQLLVVDGLLQDVKDGRAELGRGERVGLWVCFIVSLFIIYLFEIF